MVARCALMHLCIGTVAVSTVEVALVRAAILEADLGV